MKFTCLIALLALNAFLPSAAGAQWYVDNAASGAGNGTSWRDAWTSFASISGVMPGDTVNISGGSTSKKYLDRYLPTVNGLPNQPVTYRVGQDPGHSGVVIWDGQNTNPSFLYGASRYLLVSGDYQGKNHFVLTNSAFGAAVHLDFARNVQIDHLDIYSQLRFNPATNIVISNCRIQPPPLINTAILWSVSGDTLSYTNNQISNCDIILPVCEAQPAWGADGIKGGSRSSVFGNRFSVYYVPILQEWEHADAWQNLAGGGDGTSGSYCRIFNNVFANFANYAIYWEIFGNVTNALVYNNIFTQNSTMARANSLSVGVVMAVQGVNNKIIEGLVVANNTFSDYFGRGAIGFGGVSNTNFYSKCIVANNLTLNSGNSASAAIFAGDGVKPGTNGIVIANNKAIPGIRGSGSIVLAQLQYPGGSSENPFLRYAELSPLNDFRLRSPAAATVGVGMDLSAYFSTDIEGRSRYNSWSVGAYEYSGGAPNAPRNPRLQF